MWYTSVILRCPDELYTWFEENLSTGTVEQAMLAVLQQRMQTSPQVNEAHSRAYLAARLGDMPAPLEMPEPVRVMPAPHEHGAKRRHTGGRRRGNRR